jgi:hypothetical protein
MAYGMSVDWTAHAAGCGLWCDECCAVAACAPYAEDACADMYCFVGRCLQMLRRPADVSYNLMNTSAAVLAQVSAG